MCTVCEQAELRFPGAMVALPNGGVAQLVERLHGMQEVSAVRVRSPPPFAPFAIWADLVERVGYTLGGFVAGEGTFVVTRKQPPYADGSPRLRFVFQVTVATRDRPLLEALHQFLGLGSLRDTPRRSERWLPQTTLVVNSLRAHHAATIPFADRFLLPCAKRRQFEEWRQRLEAHEVDHPNRYGKGRSVCSAPGCDGLVRGRGLCRSHYYRATGY